MKQWKPIVILDAVISVPAFLLACCAAIIETWSRERIVLLLVAAFALLVMVPSIFLIRGRRMPLFAVCALCLIYGIVLLCGLLGFLLSGGFSHTLLVLIAIACCITVGKSIAVALEVSR